MKAFSIVAIVVSSIGLLGALTLYGEDLFLGVLLYGFYLSFAITVLRHTK
jgi:hypothetical protein